MSSYQNEMARKFAQKAEWANYGNDGYDKAASGAWAAWMEAAKELEAGAVPAELAVKMEAKGARHDGIAKGYAMDAYNPYDAGFAREAVKVAEALRAA